MQLETCATNNNQISPSKIPRIFKNPNYRFEVSSRAITHQSDPFDYLKIYYMYLDANQIDSVFGNAVYPSRFYGGRSYNLEHSLTDRHISTLNKAGKGVTFTLTNHFFSEAVYQSNRDFLEKHHREGNGIVCTNDQLAKRLRADFPKYQLKASLIQHLNTPEKVGRALELYDKVVIPMDKNDDDYFLEQLPEKHRVVLFGNANCAYNCTARSCYAAISQVHWGKTKSSECSKSWLPRPNLGHVFFDLDKFYQLGFRQFKLVPHLTNEAANLLQARTKPGEAFSPPRECIYLYSFPKCGRTWLRFILGQYFNLLFRLETPLDLQSLFTLLPNDNAGLKGIEDFQFAHIPALPMIVSSHGKTWAPGGILLLRSLPDVVVSDYFQQQKLGQFNGTLPEFIRYPKGSLHRYCTYLNDWASTERHAQQLVVTYEALHRETNKVISTILTRLGVERHPAHLEAAIQSASFTEMQQLEIATGHAGLPDHGGDRDMLKVRKGIVGGYVDYLSQTDIAVLFKTAREQLTTAAQHMLHQYGIGLPD